MLLWSGLQDTVSKKVLSAEKWPAINSKDSLFVGLTAPYINQMLALLQGKHKISEKYAIKSK